MTKFLMHVQSLDLVRTCLEVAVVRPLLTGLARMLRRVLALRLFLDSCGAGLEVDLGSRSYAIAIGRIR